MLIPGDFSKYDPNSEFTICLCTLVFLARRELLHIAPLPLEARSHSDWMLPKSNTRKDTNIHYKQTLLPSPVVPHPK